MLFSTVNRLGREALGGVEMYSGTNKTALMSQRLIARTLITLMEEKPWEQISISELCKSAGISRQTFYTLFSSRENVVVFTLQAKYSYVPENDLRASLPREAPASEAPCGIRALCRGYSEYIYRNRDFLRLLVSNHIDYLLNDSIYTSLVECAGFLSRTDPCIRRYAAGFYAGGISSVARCYAMEGCTSSPRQLEDLLFTFFTGALF